MVFRRQEEIRQIPEHYSGPSTWSPFLMNEEWRYEEWQHHQGLFPTDSNEDRQDRTVDKDKANWLEEGF